MRSTLHNILTLPGALLALLRLGLATKFRLRGAYWQWRWETAWGKGPNPSATARARAVLEYARWVARMRGL